MASMSMLTRYIHGLIRNKGADPRYWIKPHYITDPFFRIVVSELYDLWSARSSMNPDIITERLVSAMRAHGEEPGPVYSLVSNSLADVITPAEVKEFHDALMLQYVREDFVATINRLVASGCGAGDIDEALDRIRDLKALQPTAVADLGEQVRSALADVERGKDSIIPFGIPTMDECLGGLNRQEVEILAGRPGHGKTSFACQIARNVLDQGYKIMLVSKEMSSSRLIHKLLVNLSDNVTSSDLKKGELTAEQKVWLAETAKKMCEKYDGRLFIYDDVYDSHKIETLAAKHRPDVIIDDFIQLSKFNDLNTRLELQRIMKHYKEIAKGYNLSMLVLSQLSRAIEKREDPRPMLSDLAESGSLEQLAATVMFVFYGYVFDPAAYPQNQVEVIIPKARYAEICRLMLLFNGQNMRYSALRGRGQ